MLNIIASILVVGVIIYGIYRSVHYPPPVSSERPPPPPDSP